MYKKIFQYFHVGLILGMLSQGIYAQPNRPHIIYLDYQATTPLDPIVFKAMVPYFTEEFGNPHSSTHQYGRKAHEAVEIAREKVASLINAKTDEIIFTSGATEANNLAILGASRALKSTKNRIITSITEHKAVLDTVKSLEQEGFEVVLLSVKSDGLIDLEELKKAINDKTALVSIMTVNNEIGVIQPINEIAKIAHEYGALFHTDAAQGIGKLAIDVKALNIDLLSISGHKIYGPKGIGALYIKSGVKIEPLFRGGGQEKGLRPGTVPVPLCVGLGKAMELAKAGLAQEEQKLKNLRDYFLKILNDAKLPFIIHGSMEHRIPGNLNISFKHVEACELLPLLPNLALSLGSACSSSKTKQSYVVGALYADPNFGHTSLRIGMGRFTTKQQVDFAAKEVVKAFKKYTKSDLKEAKDISSEKNDFKTQLLNLAKKYKLIFVYKGSCPYCHLFAPILKKVVDKYNFNIQALSVDGGQIKQFPVFDTDPKLIEQYKVTAYPTLLAVKSIEESNDFVTVTDGVLLNEQKLISELCKLK